MIVPPESGRAQRVAFLAKDGASLKKGVTVAEFDPYDAQKEAAGVIAIPRGAVFEKDGKRVVYRRSGGAFVPVEITIGRPARGAQLGGRHPEGGPQDMTGTVSFS